MRSICGQQPFHSLRAHQHSSLYTAPYIFTMYRYILRSSLLNFSIGLMNPQKMKVSATAVRSATQFKTPSPSFFSCRLNFDIITQQAFSNA